MSAQGRVYGDARDLVRLSRAASYYPPGFRGNPLNLLLIDEVEAIRDARLYRKAIDGTYLLPERREIYLGEDSWPFPTFVVEGRPRESDVSDALFERFEYAKKVLLTQRQIGSELIRRVSLQHPDVVVLMIVDGVSYFDLPDSPDVIPCLVEGVTITEFGYAAVIGKPSISQRLFAAGYRSQLGFSFYDTSKNPLASELYASFGRSQVNTIASFEDCIKVLRTVPLKSGYVQITCPGLDEICHKHHDEPPKAEYLNKTMQRYYDVIDVMSSRNLSAIVCLTADHGVLWRDCLGGEKLVKTNMGLDPDHPRYVRGALARQDLVVVRHGSRTFSLLRAPLINRSLRSTEWGVHGGVSAWESIVPLVISTVTKG